MARPDKAERKRLQELAYQEELARERTALPVSVAELRGLFDYLDANLEECDDTPKPTSAYLESRGLNVAETLHWLREHGGFCDCEMFNAEESLEGLEQ